MKQRIAILLGGFSAERHVSVESGRNVYEKLASSDSYEPFPVFLAGSDEMMRFFILPINYLLKDNAEDIQKAVLGEKSFSKEDILKFSRSQNAKLTKKYGTPNYDAKEIKFDDLSNSCDFVFIALHGHPGEDGVIQKMLDKLELPYNGSDADASTLMMNKFLTNSLLKTHGFNVAKNLCVSKDDFYKKKTELFQDIQTLIKYPCIAKPINDGCSSGVKKINNELQLNLYLQSSFEDDQTNRNEILVEEFISGDGCERFMEITCGLLTHKDQSNVIYEIFQPSESIASSDILSLKEKFLAGEGQNITPARFSSDSPTFEETSHFVRNEIKKVAQALNIKGYSRIDAFLKIFKHKRAELWIIEANSLPALTPATCIFHQCIINGYTPLDFLSKIIEFGINQHGKKN